ncbi:TonB-dependent receptor [Sphingomonas antarctica]|uniref:TonB-dependent receptor n=1 Tax=Sphingomonas antarctica TaxID=2040274 RepID=UPI0039ECC0EF
MIKTHMLAGVAAIAIVASPGFAQTPQTGAATAPEAATTTPDDTGPGDIIVTAQKRSERLQDVPVAVSVVSGAALEAQGKLNLEGAVSLVPSFNFLKSGTTLNQSLFLRGVGTATFSIAGEPSISTVVDGVVYSRSGEAFGDLLDIDRIEVLRGPQGTLFGKNASAGVINIISKQPGSELGGYVEGGYFGGNGAEWRLRGGVDVPIGDNVKTRIGGFYSDYDGNIRNQAFGGRRVNGYKHYGFRAQANIDFSPNVTLALIGDYHHNNDDCCAEVIGSPPIVGATGATTTNPSTAALPTPFYDQSRTINQNLITATKETGYGFSAQLNADLGMATVTSITAYRNYKNTEIRDGDFLDRAYIGFNQLHDFGPQTGHTFSQEFRLTSPGHQLIDYVAGIYYSRAISRRIFTRNDVVCASAVVPAPTALTPCTSASAAPSTTPSGTADYGSTFKNLAFFGQATLNLGDRFRIIGGLRYTDDQLNIFHIRTTTGLATAVSGGLTVPTAAPGIQPNFDQGVFDRYTALLAAGTPTAIALAQAPLGSNGVPFRTKTTNDNLSGKAGVQFDVNHDVMAYATYARGYKGPAYNVFFNLTATGTNRISPETADAYEIGLKNSLMNGRLVINLAAYYAKYHNFQANNPDLVAGVVVTRFTNAGTISTRGGELDLLWRPVRDLNISGGVAYTDAKVDQFNPAPGAAPTATVQPGTPLAYAPKWKGSLAADYRIRTGSIEPFFGAQASYQSKQLSAFSPDPILRQLATIKAYGLVNLSAGIADADDHYRLTFQVRNVFDTSFAAAIINGGPGGAYRYQIPRDADRYYGVTGRINF